MFKVVPMLNPDGVIVGNYRTSLSGLDLNRQWATPDINSSPEIYAMKMMIKKTLECRPVHLFVDIHGHSRQNNLFLYGCQADIVPKSIKKMSSPLTSARERQLPALMER